MPVHIHNTALIYYSQLVSHWISFVEKYLQKNLYIIELLAEFHPQSFYFRGLFTSHVPVSKLREKKGSGSQTGVKVPALTIINQHHHRHHIIGIQFKGEIKKLINTGLNGLKI